MRTVHPMSDRQGVRVTHFRRKNKPNSQLSSPTESFNEYLPPKKFLVFHKRNPFCQKRVKRNYDVVIVRSGPNSYLLKNHLNTTQDCESVIFPTTIAEALPFVFNFCHSFNLLFSYHPFFQFYSNISIPGTSAELLQLELTQTADAVSLQRRLPPRQ